MSCCHVIRCAQKVLLEIFYPDSRGVNVFVGGEKEPQMLLRLVRLTQFCLGVGSGCDEAEEELRLNFTVANNKKIL